MSLWRHNFFLGWRYTRHHAKRSLTLVAALGLILWLPLGLENLVSTFAEAMLARARATPQLAGAPGSRFDLVFNALYFRGRTPPTIPQADLEILSRDGLADCVPVLLGFTARDQPLVGTTLEYFERRGLVVAEGGMLTVLGDCVLGAKVAERLGLKPGARLMSDPGNVFDIAGEYPLNMLVRGVLAPSGQPDDEAVFVDLKTVWVIEGIGHGHEKLDATTDARALLKRDDSGITANSALRQHTEITPENIASYHFHGDSGDFPISGVLVFPRDEKSGIILEARFGPRSALQIVRPEAVISEMLGLVFQLKKLLEMNFALVGTVTLVLFGLIIGLAVRLREAEFATLHRLGCTRGFILRLIVTELGLLVLGASVFAGLLLLASGAAGNGWLLHLLSL
jgi:putative ABC transport system permease protein